MSTDEESDARMSVSEKETITNEYRRTRVRRHTKIFTYDTLGQPNVQLGGLMTEKHLCNVISIIMSYYMR